MLLGFGALALVALGILGAYLLTHRHHKNATTTVVVTSPRASTPAPRASTPAPAKVVVPSVLGQPLASAEAKLRAAGLGVATTDVTSGQTAGTIVDEQPQPGSSTAKGSTITLAIAKAAASATARTTPAVASTPTASSPTTTSAAPPPVPQNATVPDLSGKTEQDAVTALNQAGILPSLFFVPAADPLGTVEQQAKAAGTTIAYHSHLQINISKGPNATTDASVPNAIGQTLTQAVSTMNGAKLRLIYVKFRVTSRTQAGKIVQQSPLAGARAPQNAQVLVFLGAFKG
jgi:beta-lactam-binding protein with PASTA domain